MNSMNNYVQQVKIIYLFINCLDFFIIESYDIFGFKSNLVR